MSPACEAFPAGTGHSGQPCIDVFNGDADGICALLQLRLTCPCPEAELVTGVKRDIGLLARIRERQGCRICVLDISLDVNREALNQLLAQDNTVFYADHHFSGPTPETPRFKAHIDPEPRVCTSLIIDRLLRGQFRTWAIAGAYGDNLDEEAEALAQGLGLGPEAAARLRETGRLLNYNAYGLSLDDLCVPPAVLFREAQNYGDIFDFHHASALLHSLRGQYAEDMAQAAGIRPYKTFPQGQVFLLPNAPWARRMSGILANRAARGYPGQAQAVLLPYPDGDLLVSVRAPLTSGKGADTLCRQFASGGGRAAAAGINRLPHQSLDRFLDLFAQHFSP